MIQAWSVRITNYLKDELSLDKNKVAIVSYGLEVLIGGLVKLAVYLCIPTLFGVFYQFAAAFLSAAFLRLTAGGAHCTAYYRCLISTTVVFLTIALIARYFYTYITHPDVLLWASLFISLPVFIKNAPVDVKEKPIISPVRRKILKYMSCRSLLLYFIAFNYWDLNNEIIISISIAVLFQSFSLTKYGSLFLEWVDKKI